MLNNFVIVFKSIINLNYFQLRKLIKQVYSRGVLQTREKRNYPKLFLNSFVKEHRG